MIIDSPIVSGSQFISGSSTQVGNAVISGSLTVTGGINATITGSISSASFANTASFALTASYLSGYVSPFPFTGSAIISGSLLVTGSLNVSDQIQSQVLITPQTLSRDISIPDYHNALILGPSNIAGNITVGTGSNLIVIEDFTNLATTGSNTFTGNQIVSGSLAVTQGITGSLLGNASSATTSITASYASNAELLDGLDSTSFATTTSFNSLSSSFATTSGSIAGRVATIENKYATTGSNTFTGTQYISDATNATSFVSTAALYTDGGLRVSKDAYVSGTAYFNNITVYGTSSIEYITSSQINIGANLITLNTDTPAVRFGGISVYDSGSNNTSTGSLFWDSEKNRWIYANPSGSEYDGGIIVSGPKNTSGLGNEQGLLNNVITKGQGGDHITSSQITDDGTTVSIPGNLTVTGSIVGTITNATSASYALTASYASNVPLTASNADTASFAFTASYIETAQTASYVLNAVSSSFALTASYISGSGAGVGFPFSGSAVITGSLLITDLSGSGVRYVTTDANGLLVAQTASAAIISTQLTYATAGQTIFPISGGYTTGLVDVFVNGTKLNSTEYVDTSGVNIVLTTGSFVNDVVEFQKYFPASGVTNNALRQQNYFTATAGQTVFSASYTPGLLDVFYNGSKLDNTEYIANSGNAITLATASNAGDKIEIDVYSYQVGSFSGIGGTASGSQIAYFTATNGITGSPNFTVSGSSIVVTGSLVVSGSGTFVNIGPAVFSGSLTSTQGFTGSFSGIATTASFAQTASSIANLNQNVQVTGSLTVSSTITAQTLNVQQVTSSIVYSSGSNIFGSALGNIQQMTGSLQVTSSNASYFLGGNVGIGTTTPGSALEVRGGIGMTAAAGLGYSFNIYSNGQSGSNITLAQGFANATDNIGFLYNRANADFVFGTNNTERMRISGSGNVGIGTSTPNYLLHAYGAKPQLAAEGNSTNGAGILLNTNLSGADRRNWFIGTEENVAGDFVVKSSNAAGGNANSGTTRISILNNGNVGLSTTNPTARLDIRSDVAATTSLASTTIKLYNGSDGGAAIEFGNSVGGSSKLSFGVEAVGSGTDDTYMSFSTGPNASSSERVRITSAGNMLVNAGYVYINGEGNGVAVDSGTASVARVGLMKYGGFEGMLVSGNTTKVRLCHRTDSDYVFGGTPTIREDLVIQTNGTVTIAGTLSKGGGSFKIDHPLPEKKDTHFLFHSFIEGPTPDLIYRGVVALVNGTATINIDEVSDMTEGTFVLLNKRVQCFTTNESGWDLTRGKVVGNILTIESQNPNSTDEISWMVIGERADEWMRNSDMTDEDGKIIVEKLKPVTEEI